MSRSAPSAACWKSTRASASCRAWKSLMAASNAANCVRAGAAWGTSARGARSEFLLFRAAWGFVMRLSAIRTQHGYIRPRYRDATGAVGLGRLAWGGWLSDSRFPEKLGGLFRRRRVDVEARGPFEAGDLGKPGDDLDVPVIVCQRAFLDGRAVHDEIECRPFQHLF